MQWQVYCLHIFNQWRLSKVNDQHQDMNLGKEQMVSCKVILPQSVSYTVQLANVKLAYNFV